MITYAQNFEDVLLARVFKGRSSGFYVDVGAGDPTKLSVTKWFYDLGWTGINIEPNRALNAKLVAERPRDINLNLGAGAVRHDAVFHEFPVSELSSFDVTIKDRAIRAGILLTSRCIQVLPLTEVIDIYAQGREIDFVKIDVEGWEKEVLQGFDLKRYRPTVIVVEATLPETQVECHFEWEGLLTEGAFVSVYFDGLNRFYIPREKIELKSCFATPPNVYDEITPLAVVEGAAALNSLSAELIAAKDLNLSLVTKLSEYQVEGAAQLQKIVQLRETNSSKHHEIVGLLREQAITNARTDQLGSALKKKMSDCETLKNDLFRLRSELAELGVAVSQSDARADQLGSALEAKVSEFEALRNNLLRLRNELAGLGVAVSKSMDVLGDALDDDEASIRIINEATRILRSRKAILRRLLRATIP